MTKKGLGFRVILFLILLAVCALLQQLFVQPQATDERGWQPAWGSSESHKVVVDRNFAD